jgi:hypothetical protein
MYEALESVMLTKVTTLITAFYVLLRCKKKVLLYISTDGIHSV